MYWMPFDPLFWRASQHGDAIKTWNVAKDSKQAFAPTSTPDRVLGFIVALPTNWSGRENNLSGLSLTVLADIGPTAEGSGMQIAQAEAGATPNTGVPV